MSFIDRLAQLNALHLYGMAAAWNELLAEGPRLRIPMMSPGYSGMMSPTLSLPSFST